jgi:hypothetical protein
MLICKQAPFGAELVGTVKLSDKTGIEAAPIDDMAILSRPTIRSRNRTNPVLLKKGNRNIICGPSSNIGQSYTKAADQVQLSDVLNCNTPSSIGCSQTISKSVMVTSTLTTSDAVTVTFGGSMNETIGLALIFSMLRPPFRLASHMPWRILRQSRVQQLLALLLHKI